MTMKTHELKCWPESFEAIYVGAKTADLRNDDDRVFEVGDWILLREWEPQTQLYTGRHVVVEVTHVDGDDINPKRTPWVPEGWALLSISIIEPKEDSEQ